MSKYPASEPIFRSQSYLRENALMRRVLSLLNKCHVIISASSPPNDSLSTGRLGMALYYHQSYKAFERSDDGRRAQDLLETVIKNVNNNICDLFNPSFAHGLAGLAYLLKHFDREKFVDISMESEFSEIDNYLFRYAFRQIERGRNDYLHGAFGIIFYFLCRCEEPVIRGYVDALLNEVLTKAEMQSDGPMIKNFIIHRDANRINLSLSHGQAGFLLILMQALILGFQEERLTVYIKRGIAAILQYQIRKKRNSRSSFPFETFLDRTSEDIVTNRLGWCYGDLNQILLLYEAASLFGESHYNAIADRIGNMSVTRIRETDTMCFDSHFCHGSSGLAQTYKKLYDLSKLPVYQSAYLHWINKTAELLERDLEKGLYLGKETGFLDGLIGPALVLLSFVTEEDSGWSKCWLL